MSDMTIETAVAHILGEVVAHSIITEMGVHWAVVAAMAKAATDDNPSALAAIRTYNDRNKATPWAKPTPPPVREGE